MDKIKILLVEDNPGDIRLTQEAIKVSKLIVDLEIVMDGAEAISFLRKEGKYSEKKTPDLVILDLNLPKVDGREVLENIKSDKILKVIPVVVLTTSSSEEDVLRSYGLHANCYITKPLGFEEFIEVVKKIENFWLSIVKLPFRG